MGRSSRPDGDGGNVADLFFSVEFGLGCLVTLAMSSLVFVALRKIQKSLHRAKTINEIDRFIIRGEMLEYCDLGKIVGSLERQFEHRNIRAIIGVDSGGYIVGQILAHKLTARLGEKVQCYRIEVKTADTQDGEKFFAIAGEHEFQKHLEKLKPSKFAVLIDFDPKGQRIGRVADWLKGNFQDYHTYNKAFVVINKRQHRQEKKLKALSNSSSEEEVIWAAKTSRDTLEMPWEGRHADVGYSEERRN